MRSVESIATPPVVPCVPIDSLQFLELFDDVNVDGGIGVPLRFFRVKKQQRSFRYWPLAACGQKSPKCLAPLQSTWELFSYLSVICLITTRNETNENLKPTWESQHHENRNLRQQQGSEASLPHLLKARKNPCRNVSLAPSLRNQICKIINNRLPGQNRTIFVRLASREDEYID